MNSSKYLCETLEELFFESLNNQIVSDEAIEKFINFMADLYPEEELSEDLTKIRDLKYHYRKHVAKPGSELIRNGNTALYSPMSLEDYDKSWQELANFDWEDKVICNYGSDDTIEKIIDFMTNGGILVFYFDSNTTKRFRQDCYYIFRNPSPHITVDGESIYDILIMNNKTPVTLMPILEKSFSSYVEPLLSEASI